MVIDWLFILMLSSLAAVCTMFYFMGMEAGINKERDARSESEDDQ